MSGRVAKSGQTIGAFFSMSPFWPHNYPFFSFTSVLPWSTCDSSLNTKNCVVHVAMNNLTNSKRVIKTLPPTKICTTHSKMCTDGSHYLSPLKFQAWATGCDNLVILIVYVGSVRTVPEETVLLLLLLPVPTSVWGRCSRLHLPPSLPVLDVFAHIFNSPQKQFQV